MPKLTRWFLKSSLICFMLALVVGVLLSLRPLLSLPKEIDTFNPAYFHLFMFGWVAQLIFGVVYWMFPRYSKDRPHRSKFLGWLTFGFLNVGLSMRVIVEPISRINSNSLWGWTVALSAVLQWLAGVFFVFNTWARVKER